MNINLQIIASAIAFQYQVNNLQERGRGVGVLFVDLKFVVSIYKDINCHHI